MKSVESGFDTSIVWYYSNKVRITTWSTAAIKPRKSGQANTAFCPGKQQAFRGYLKHPHEVTLNHLHI